MSAKRAKTGEGARETCPNTHFNAACHVAKRAKSSKNGSLGDHTQSGFEMWRRTPAQMAPVGGGKSTGLGDSADGRGGGGGQLNR